MRPKTMPNHTTPPDDVAPRQGQKEHCMKVFVQRDYSDGTIVRFLTHFPPELEGRLDRASFECTVNQLNTYFAEAEKGSCSTYCEGCLACLTAYLVYICSETHYEKCLRKVAKFVMEQNERVYMPRGLLLTSPVDRGLRVTDRDIHPRSAYGRQSLTEFIRVYRRVFYVTYHQRLANGSSSSQHRAPQLLASYS